MIGYACDCHVAVGDAAPIDPMITTITDKYTHDFVRTTPWER